MNASDEINFYELGLSDALRRLELELNQAFESIVWRRKDLIDPASEDLENVEASTITAAFALALPDAAMNHISNEIGEMLQIGGGVDQAISHGRAEAWTWYQKLTDAERAAQDERIALYDLLWKARKISLGVGD